MTTIYLAADVARLYGVTPARVHALDERLNPTRTPNGTRVYARDAVDFELGRRLARAA